VVDLVSRRKGAEVLEWLGPAFVGVKHRQEIKDMLSGGLSRLLGKKTSIAFTGMPGVGKSVLADHLTGKAFKMGYRYPLQSQAVEKTGLKAVGKRMVFDVIPGQDAEPRHVAMDSLFRKRGTVDGVVHVVGFGYVSLRNEAAKEELIRVLKVNTLAKYRDHQLDAELRDLEGTLEAIRTSLRSSRKPKWLVIALDKVDLYKDRLPQAIKHYTSDTDSPFVAMVERFRGQVGTDNMRVAASAVCSCVEGFEWNGKTVETQCDLGTRNRYLEEFLRLLASFCA
jgi:hypothetical protein